MSRKATSKTPSCQTSETDWERLDAMQDEDIDLSDIPEMTPEMMARAVLRKGLQPIPRKKQITLRIDEDVLAWFRAQGKGYQTQINTLLREYMKVHDAQSTKGHRSDT